MVNTGQGASRTGGLILAAMIFASPLVQGGTPRLGTVILEAFFLLGLAAAAAPSRTGAFIPGRIGAVEGTLYLFLLAAAANLPRVAYYHDAERCFLLIAMYAGVYSLMVRLPGAGPEKPLFGAIMAASLFQAAVALFQAIARGEYQPAGTFDNYNFLAGFLVIGACLFLAGALDLDGTAGAPRAWRRPGVILRLAAAAFILAALLWTRSRGGMMALAISATALLVARFGAMGLAPAAAAAAALLSVPNPFRERLAHLSTSDVWAWSRLGMWRGAADMFLDHPLGGIGMGQYQYFSPRYAFPVEGHWARFAKIADNPHSEVMMLGAEFGLAGLFILVLFAAALGRGVWRARRQGKRSWWPLLILAGSAAQSAVDFSLHSPPVVLASLSLLAAWRRRETSPVWADGVSLRPKSFRVACLVIIPLFGLLAARAPAGFYWFLRAGGGPVNFMNEKASLAAWSGGGNFPREDLIARAIFWDGDCAPYHSIMGSLHAKRYAATGDRRRLELAFSELGEAMRLNPNNHLYPSQLGDLYLSLYRRGELREGLALARRATEEARALAPFNVRLLDRLGALDLESGDAALAAEEFARAVELEPCFLRAGYGLGCALEGLGRGREARERYLLTLERARDCGRRLPQSDYERALIDLDTSLVHNRLDSPVRADRVPGGALEPAAPLYEGGGGAQPPRGSPPPALSPPS